MEKVHASLCEIKCSDRNNMRKMHMRRQKEKKEREKGKERAVKRKYKPA